MVVSLDDLSCLDALIWFGAGDAAARKMRVTQSTISRAARRVADLFQLTLLKGPSGEWFLHGDQHLLTMERFVHQQYRWNRNYPLRLEAQYYSGPLFAASVSGDYLLGNFNFLNVATPTSLLRSGVIDAWIGCFPDVPHQDDSELASFSLTRLPTRLVVSQGHPLLKLGNAVTLDDVIKYPSLALPDGAFPNVQRRLQSLGLWNTPARLSRYQTALWEGKTEDNVTVAYATSFTMDMFPDKMIPLPIDISMDVGDVLIVRRSFVDHSRFQVMLKDLQDRAVQLANQYADVTLAF